MPRPVWNVPASQREHIPSLEPADDDRYFPAAHQKHDSTLNAARSVEYVPALQLEQFRMSNMPRPV
eukprot:CAMPEP_0172177942 /NCGR_PEP_ID=MMETSP1050-20130122/15741_1 /TAXON_ID=233186 /ORGANISM="Cryptomonas curvata, Strain CCAP979/52" /LENGTH=65 /DNA_ID=CAMNT_0012850567 /DNA_START=490 /DNA_END=687 /DNA_ORIENTATION=+